MTGRLDSYVISGGYKGGEEDFPLLPPWALFLKDFFLKVLFKF